MPKTKRFGRGAQNVRGGAECELAGECEYNHERSAMCLRNLNRTISRNNKRGKRPSDGYELNSVQVNQVDLLEIAHHQNGLEFPIVRPKTLG